MEQRIETAIDCWLESIASPLHLLSIALGVALLVLGVIFLLQKRRGRGASLCFAVGLLALLSGWLQL